MAAADDAPDDQPDDLHLEDPDDPRSRKFTDRENARLEAWLHDGTYEADRRFARDVIESENKLFACRRRGDWLYDFHRDAAHPRGLWRRIPAGETPGPDAVWQPVFDVDAYCTETGGEWAWRGTADGPTPGRVMIHLAEGGSDVGVHREFDLETCAFVEGGFETPPAKGFVHWLGADALLVTVSTPGHATSSGWPATVRRWRRGEALDDAEVLLRADDADLTVRTYATGEGEDAIVSLAVMHDINGRETLEVLRGDERRRVDLPNPRQAAVTSSHILWQPLKDAEGEDTEGGRLRAGNLYLRPLSTGDDATLFEAGPRRVVDYFQTSDRWAYAIVSDDLAPELHMLDMGAPERGLRRVPLPGGMTALSAFWLRGDPDAESDHTVLAIGSGPLRPPALFRFDPDRDDFGAEREPEAEQAARFDPAGMRLELVEARSDDGTAVPYHVVLPAGEGPHPVVVNAYGGFNISNRAGYMNVWGRLLLERGVGMAFAYIRGGGEFGPAWHRAALRHERHRAFEDCAAVARDLVERGLAPQGGVGLVGGSNGGLLAGVMATRYPHLFGAICSIVPVTDMLRFHTFPAGRAWIDEYGDPDDPADAAYLRSYSPWHQVRPASEAAYPPVLIDAPVNDDRVDPSHARRFADRLLRAEQPAWLRTAGTGGHGGGDASEAVAANSALRAAFFRRTLLGEGSAPGAEASTPA